MIEKVARAICWKNGMNPDLTLGGDGQNFLWMEYEAQAEAAIAAMRIPTGKMIFHGEKELERVEGYNLSDVFTAMMDAAVGGEHEPHP